MKLKDFEQLFLRIRGLCEILVSGHAFKRHSDRGFTKKEIVLLVKEGEGRMRENTFPTAIPKSFLFCTKDEDGRQCEFVLLIENIDGLKEKRIIVCSAYRRGGI